MDVARVSINWSKRLISTGSHIIIRFLILWIILSAVLTSCESDPYGSNWDENIQTIGEYLKTNNKEENSKFYRLLIEGKMLSSLSAYNPYGEGYTLFLPTDEAVDRFIQQSPNYENFEELLQDTSFIYMLTRYHTINKRVHTNEFPDGALTDRTLTGDRLTTGFYTEKDNLLIKVNNVAPIVKSNLEMTNGYVHVISEVLQQVEISGYDWLQAQDDYSILAQAMELAQIKGKLWFDKYTIFAEPDSVYYKNGIMDIEDLINRVSTPGVPYWLRTNSFYIFVGYHILGEEFYLNDFYWGNKDYWTLGYLQLGIDVGQEIQINSGVEDFGIKISEAGDTTIIDYVSPVWEHSNIMTSTGPIHSISNILSFESFPWNQ